MLWFMYLNKPLTISIKHRYDTSCHICAEYMNDTSHFVEDKCDYLLMIKQVYHSCYCQEEYKCSLHYWNLSYRAMIFWSVQIFPEFLYSVSSGELLESRHRSVAERCSVSSVFSWCLLSLHSYHASLIQSQHPNPVAWMRRCVWIDYRVLPLWLCVWETEWRRDGGVCVDVWVCEHHAFVLLMG